MTNDDVSGPAVAEIMAAASNSYEGPRRSFVFMSARCPLSTRHPARPLRRCQHDTSSDPTPLARMLPRVIGVLIAGEDIIGCRAPLRRA
jgi:hypothetical protein